MLLCFALALMKNPAASSGVSTTNQTRRLFAYLRPKGRKIYLVRLNQYRSILDESFCRIAKFIHQLNGIRSFHFCDTVSIRFSNEVNQ